MQHNQKKLILRRSNSLCSKENSKAAILMHYFKSKDKARSEWIKFHKITAPLVKLKEQKKTIFNHKMKSYPWVVILDKTGKILLQGDVHSNIKTIRSFAKK